MNNEQSVKFLFTITNEIKRSYESPVIFLTFKDYEDQIFDTLVHLRRALVDGITKEQLQDVFNDFHLDWLRAVIEVETFRKQMRETPRATIQNAITNTIECLKKRNMYLARYARKSSKIMTSKEQYLFEAELEIVDQMMYSTTAVLTQKQLSFQYQVDQTEFTVRLNFEVEELLNWVDRLYNNLAVAIGDVLDPGFQEFMPTLTNPLKDLKNLKKTKFSEGEKNGNLTQLLDPIAISRIESNRYSRELEMSKIEEKLKKLNSRLKSLNNVQGAVALGLKHQIEYLDERLQTLKTLKQAHADFSGPEDQDSQLKQCEIELKEIQIFSHFLPQNERYELIEMLKKQWDAFLSSETTECRPKSLLTLLSFTDTNEMFMDDYGDFTVDKYGRKLYTKEDNLVYQLNERQMLVPLDDDDHIYFYDDCGRYYFNENRRRIYKADRTASEYMLHPNGRLVKWKEVKDNIDFYFDNLGRHFFNDEGLKIYREKGEDYVTDGLGNLLKLRTSDVDYDFCPQDTKIATAESKYLQQEVGTALKVCIRDVILHLPEDPVQYLAECLINYRRKEEKKQENQTLELALKVERENLHEDESKMAELLENAEDENSEHVDHNLKNYISWNSDSSFT